MAKAVGLPQNSYCLFAKVRASLPDSTGGLVDFDNDGWRDLLAGQGHVMDDISDSDPALAHHELILLARNLFGRYYDVAARAGPAFRRRLAARGVAFGDLDGDGRVDAAINVNDGPALVLRNVGAAGNSLTLSLERSGDNLDGVGATVRIRDSRGVEQAGFRGSARSYLSVDSSALHFGFGGDASCESVTVRWSHGTTQTFTDPGGPIVRIRQAQETSEGSR